jgi:hypothetical protein
MATNESLQREASRALFQTVCICGEPKRRRSAFCNRCWDALPRNMRPSLYINYSNHSAYANFWHNARRFLAMYSNRPVYRHTSAETFLGVNA